MDDGMDDGTKLHFIPTSAATVHPASGEASFVRLQGKIHSDSFKGRFIGLASSQPDGWTDSGEASFGRPHSFAGSTSDKSFIFNDEYEQPWQIQTGG